MRVGILSCSPAEPRLESEAMEGQYPLARTRGLLCETVDGEIVVLDRHSQKACRLNRPAAIVWLHCDGRTAAGDLAAIVQSELGLAGGAEAVVELALEKLEALGLLATGADITRRGAARRLALAAAAIPLVTAISVPTPARAQSRAIRTPAPAPDPPAPAPSTRDTRG